MTYKEIDVISIKYFRKRLDPGLLQKIEELDEQDEVIFYEKAKQMEEERLNRLQDLERSG
ncbi:MAG: hypothetical protein ACTSRI_00380 [Promethearchaeota archaeon]